MPDRKFKVGDLVRATAAGRDAQVSGYLDERLEVISLCDGKDYLGEPLVETRRISTGKTLGGWRESWYELVDDGGPW